MANSRGGSAVPPGPNEGPLSGTTEDGLNDSKRGVSCLSTFGGPFFRSRMSAIGWEADRPLAATRGVIAAVHRPTIANDCLRPMCGRLSIGKGLVSGCTWWSVRPCVRPLVRLSLPLAIMPSADRIPDQLLALEDAWAL